MALINCPECKHEVSTAAEKCSNCGATFLHSKSRGIAIILAIFFGSFGIHRFYLGRNVSGIIYLIFFWTGIPLIFGLLEAIELVGMGENSFKKKYCQTDLGRQAIEIPSSRRKIQIAAFALFGIMGGCIVIAGKRGDSQLSAKAANTANDKGTSVKSNKKSSILYKMINHDEQKVPKDN